MSATKTTEIVSTLKQDISQLYDLWRATSDDFGYPVDYQGITTKSEPLISQLEGFRGKRVLDIGCNSGMYSYSLGACAKSVIGCDVEPVLIKRANEARAFFDRMYDTKTVQFHHGNFVDKLDNEIDGVIASLVLYHVGDENLLALKNFLTERKPHVLLQARPMRAEAFKNSPSWGILSATTMYGGMYLIEDNLNFLRDCGYNSVEVTGLTESLFFGEHFPVIVARG